MALILFLGLAAVSFIPGMEKRYDVQIMMGVMFACGLIGIKVGRVANLFAAALFLMVTVSAAYICFAPDSPFSGYALFIEGKLVTAGALKFGSSAAISLLYILAVVIPVLETDDQNFDNWLVGFGWLGLFSSSIILVKFTKGLVPDSILDNPAMDATFIACLYPLMVLRATGGPSFKNLTEIRAEPMSAVMTFLFVLLPIFAIGVSGSSTAMAVLFGELALYRFLVRNISIQSFAEAALVLVIGIVASNVLLGEQLLNPNGRYNFWIITADQWVAMRHYIIGTGAGSFENLAPMAMHEAHAGVSIFWAHNEYFQVCFEYGFLGLILLLAFLGTLVRAAIYSAVPWLLVTVVGLSAAAVTQMPLRLYPWSLFCAVICRLTFKLYKEDREKSRLSRSIEI